MKITQTLSDKSVLQELGARLAQQRIALGHTQAQLAEKAGIGKRTLERFEAGATIQLTSFIRILREMGILEALGALVPEAGPRPMDLLKLSGKTRLRAFSRRKRKDSGPGSREWLWGDNT